MSSNSDKYNMLKVGVDCGWKFWVFIVYSVSVMNRNINKVLCVMLMRNKCLLKSNW